jgi:porin
MNLTARSDLLGFGVSRGEPFEGGQKDQYTAELFYRWQLSQNLAITPDIQYLRNPALNPDESSILVLGIRVRLTL